MAGIHFRFSVDAGQKLGDKVGKWTLYLELEAVRFDHQFEYEITIDNDLNTDM